MLVAAILIHIHVVSHLSWNAAAEEAEEGLVASFRPAKRTLHYQSRGRRFYRETRHAESRMREEGIPFRWTRRLSRDFYDRDTTSVARQLIGKILVRRYNGSFRLGRITETEAYLGFDDPASHVGRGRFTFRTEGVWGRPGVAYVFLAYGVHRCFNAITLSREPYGGVLIRGVERLRLRGGEAIPTGVADDGPGKVCRYLRIGIVHNGADLVDGNIRILSRGFEPEDLSATPRVGISKARIRPLRFVTSEFREA